MSLLETIEELKKQKDAAIESEAKVEEVVEEIVEEVVEKEEPKVEEVKEEPKEEKEPEEKLDSQAYARLRREKAAAEKKAKDLEAQIAKPKEENADQGAEEVTREFAEILQERKERKAAQEFATFEQDFKVTVDDYDDVAQQYLQAQYAALRFQNPRKSHAELAELTQKTVLYKSSEYLRNGYENPVQALYDEAKSLGFGKLPKAKEETTETEEEKPQKASLEKIAANKQRNSGMAGSKGSGGEATLTKKSAAEMTNQQWAALTKEEKARVLRGG